MFPFAVLPSSASGSGAPSLSRRSVTEEGVPPPAPVAPPIVHAIAIAHALARGPVNFVQLRAAFTARQALVRATYPTEPPPFLIIATGVGVMRQSSLPERPLDLGPSGCRPDAQQLTGLTLALLQEADFLLPVPFSHSLVVRFLAPSAKWPSRGLPAESAAPPTYASQAPTAMPTQAAPTAHAAAVAPPSHPARIRHHCVPRRRDPRCPASNGVHISLARESGVEAGSASRSRSLSHRSCSIACRHLGYLPDVRSYVDASRSPSRG